MRMHASIAVYRLFLDIASFMLVGKDLHLGVDFQVLVLLTRQHVDNLGKIMISGEYNIT
jgi:hypothetical protein